MLENFIKQGRSAAALAKDISSYTSEVVSKIDSGDDVFYAYKSSIEFFRGQSVANNLVFSISQDADFDAYRLSIYPYARQIDPSNPLNNDVAFRPTIWTSSGVINPVGEDSSAVDCSFSLSVSDRTGQYNYQNIPFMSGSLYCSYVNSYTAAGQTARFPITENPGSMTFCVPMQIARGGSVICRATPLFSGQDDAVYEAYLQYRIVGVLEGKKKVRAFK